MTHQRILFLIAVLILFTPVIVYHTVIFRFLGRPRVVWTYRTTVYVLPWTTNLAVGPDRTVYVLTDHLDALDHDGRLKWQSRQYTVPAIARDGTGYFAGNGGSFLRALGPSGDELWTLKFDSTVTGLERPDWISEVSLGTHGELYAGGLRLWSIHQDGSVNWTLGNPDVNVLYLRPLIGPDGTIYVERKIHSEGDPDFRVTLLAVDPQGNELWSQEIYDSFANFIPMADGRVLATNFNGSRYPGFTPHVPGHWISHSGLTDDLPKSLQDARYVVLTKNYVYTEPIPQTGIRKISYSGAVACETRPFFLDSAPVVAKDGTVYVGGEHGALLAFTSNCLQAWRMDFVTRITSVIIGEDGTIYALGQDGIVRAIRELFGNGGLPAEGWPNQNHDSRNSNSAVPD